MVQPACGDYACTLDQVVVPTIISMLERKNSLFNRDSAHESTLVLHPTYILQSKVSLLKVKAFYRDLAGSDFNSTCEVTTTSGATKGSGWISNHVVGNPPILAPKKHKICPNIQQI